MDDEALPTDLRRIIVVLREKHIEWLDKQAKIIQVKTDSVRPNRSSTLRAVLERVMNDESFRLI